MANKANPNDKSSERIPKNPESHARKPLMWLKKVCEYHRREG